MHNGLKEELAALISRDRLVEMTAEMIKIPSYAGVPNQETPVAEYIKKIFDLNGITCELKEVSDGRCNVIARLKAPNSGKTLLLNGHMDTVEPNDMVDAFEPLLLDGNLYGRGASDMKGPIAAMIEAMLAVKKSGKLKAGEIIFSGVLDEEHGSIGTIDLLESGVTADGAIVGEPTGLEIHTAHRGLEWFKFHFIGKTVHGGSQSEGINAIAKAVDFINAMEKTLIPEIYSRKHDLLKEATLNYGVIHGGTQLSTVAGECDLYVDRRFLPYETYDEVVSQFKALIAELSAKDPQFKCEMQVTEESAMKEGYVHLPMEIALDHPLVKFMQNAVSLSTGKEPVMSFFPAWTDGGLLKGYKNIPTVVFGPGLISCCHSKEEHIPVNHLPKAALTYALAALDFCQS